jgi:hypothetical protein
LPPPALPIFLPRFLLCSVGQGQRGKNRVMVAWVDRGLRVAVSQDCVRLGSEALSAVLEEYPVDATRRTPVAYPVTAAQQEVPQPFERVERFGILIISAAGGLSRKSLAGKRTTLRPAD